MNDATKMDPLREAFRQHAEWAQESALAEERRASKPDCGHEEWIAHRERAKAYRDCESMARAALSAVAAPPHSHVVEFDCACGMKHVVDIPCVSAPQPAMTWTEQKCGRCGCVRARHMDLAGVAGNHSGECAELGCICGAFVGAETAPPPGPQGWEEIERLVECWEEALVRLTEMQRPHDSEAKIATARETESAARATLLRALRASVSGHDYAGAVACSACSGRLESDFRWCPHCGAMSPRERIRRGWVPLGPSSSEIDPGGAAGGDADEPHACGYWRLSPRLTWICGGCGAEAPPLSPGGGDPIRVACPSCDAPGFTRAELTLHRCAAPDPAGEGTKTCS